jgi:hypothetical protein
MNEVISFIDPTDGCQYQINESPRVLSQFSMQIIFKYI